jgi:hypothetical protein
VISPIIERDDGGDLRVRAVEMTVHACAYGRVHAHQRDAVFVNVQRDGCSLYGVLSVEEARAVATMLMRAADAVDEQEAA